MYLWIAGAVLVLGGLVYSYVGSHPNGIIDGEHEGDVRTTIAQFGNQLNTVSVLAPTAAEDIRSAYGPYVSPELLATWIATPSIAPGRLSSSPWPDHLEVDTVTLAENGSYDVMGRIILKTSSGDAGIIPVSLSVANIDGSYLITAYQENPGSPEPAPMDNTVTAALGETVSFNGVTLTPLTVEEDSRCPMDAMCIQAGTTRVAIEVVSGMGTSTMTATLNEPVTTEAESITLVEVMPYPMASNPTEDEQYRFTFLIETR